MHDNTWLRHGSRSRTGRLLRVGLLAAMAAMMLAFAACGDDDDSGGSTGGGGEAAQTSTAKQPTGKPIKVLTITTLEAQNVPTYKNIEVTAKAYEKWINSKGGISGRPLAVTVCDDRGDPAQAGSCARKAVQDGAVAAVGSFTFFGDATVPVLEKADTAWFGICCQQSASELTSKVSFGFGNTLYGAGAVARAYDDGCQNVNAVIVQGAEGVFRPVMENAAKAYGKKINKFITLPTTAKDYSPQVAEATGNNADCAIVIFGETLFQAWMPAWQQSGTDVKMYGPQGNLNEVAIKGFEDAAEGSIIAGIYPDLSTEPWADYRAALEQADAPDLDYNSLGGLGTWAAYNGFTKVVEGMDGDITAKTFLDAASKTTSLDLDGQVPELNLSKPWGDKGPKGFNRVFSCGVIFSKIEGGKVKPDTTEFQSAEKLALGEGKLSEPGAPAACGAGGA
ncbi:MAG: ABC transporter substrate-binding protein [Solirubrobacterales bacterium]|nr:ABC transporter substrate-binding protein [Solirubrobacterales bacterium]